MISRANLPCQSFAQISRETGIPRSTIKREVMGRRVESTKTFYGRRFNPCARRNGCDATGMRSSRTCTSGTSAPPSSGSERADDLCRCCRRAICVSAPCRRSLPRLAVPCRFMSKSTDGIMCYRCHSRWRNGLIVRNPALNLSAAVQRKKGKQLVKVQTMHTTFLRTSLSVSSRCMCRMCIKKSGGVDARHQGRLRSEARPHSAQGRQRLIHFFSHGHGWSSHPPVRPPRQPLYCCVRPGDCSEKTPVSRRFVTPASQPT